MGSKLVDDKGEGGSMFAIGILGIPNLENKFKINFNSWFEGGHYKWSHTHKIIGFEQEISIKFIKLLKLTSRKINKLTIKF